VGGSTNIGPDGFSLALWNYDGTEQILRAECDLDRVRRKRHLTPHWGGGRPASGPLRRGHRTVDPHNG